MLYEERVKEIIDAKSRELATRHHAHDQKHIVHHRVAPTFANRVGRYGIAAYHSPYDTLPALRLFDYVRSDKLLILTTAIELRQIHRPATARTHDWQARRMLRSEMARDLGRTCAAKCTPVHLTQARTARKLPLV